MDFSEIFKRKKIFLTGHTGFKGSWLLIWLHLLGAEVKGYALAPQSEFDLYYKIDGDKLCCSEIADIRDGNNLRRAILEFEPDYIFHLAAQPLVRISYELPVDTFSINIIGTANVLDAIRYLGKPCIVVMITTDKVYHNKEENYFYNETDRLGGYDPYSASKAAAEIVIDSYRKSFFNPLNYSQHQKSISVARAGNVIGGGDWSKDRIIPDIIKALSQGESILVRNPKSVRPWQHVLEPLNGYLALASLQSEDPVKFAAAYNFGPAPQDNLTVEQVITKAIEIWGKGTYHSIENLTSPHEAGLLQLDINKANSELNWFPKYNANIAIEKTIQWYKEVSFQKNEHAFNFTVQQIKEYETVAS